MAPEKIAEDEQRRAHLANNLRVPAGNIRCHACRQLLFENSQAVRERGGIMLGTLEWIVSIHRGRCVVSSHVVLPSAPPA